MKKRIYSLFLSIVALAIIFTASFAWLSMNKSTGSHGMGMTIQAVNDITTISCYALRYDGIYGAQCYKIGEGDGEIQDVTMTEFDKIFRDRNVNTPLIYVVEVGNVSTDSNAYIGIRVPCYQKYIKPDGAASTNDYSTTGHAYEIEDYISNVISVKINSGGATGTLTPALEHRYENNVQVFNSAMEDFKSITSGDAASCFASATMSGGTKTFHKENFLELKIPSSQYASDVFVVEEEGVSENHVILYIQFDYDNALMDAFIEYFESKDIENANFESDLGIIQLINGTIS